MAQTQIYWAPANAVVRDGPPSSPEAVLDDLFTMEPIRVLPTILSDERRNYAGADAAYRNCPSFISYMKNLYELRAISDIEFQIDEARTVTKVEAPLICPLS